MSSLIRASDVKSFKECSRKFWYQQHQPEDVGEEDPFDKHLSKKGSEHEARVKRKLEEELGVEMIRATSVEHTEELIAHGAQAIYQPQFVDKDQQIEGRADFLLRTQDGEYQVGDAKFSSSIKENEQLHIRLQMGIYRMLARSELPARVFLRFDQEDSVADEVNSVVATTLSEMRTVLQSDDPPETHYGATKCGGCLYNGRCTPKFQERGELTLLPDLDKDVANTLRQQGITAIEQLANAEVPNIRNGYHLKRQEKKHRLIQQAKSYLTGEVFQTDELILPHGTPIYFDVEAQPFSDAAPVVVYLWGFLLPPYEPENMEFVWSDGSKKEDKHAWLEFLNRVERYKQEHSNVQFVHYSHYEKDRIKNYRDRFDMSTHPTVEWLLAPDGPLFDLHPPVKNSLVLPVNKYGIKELCKDERLVNFQWELEESGSQWSVVRYMDFLDATSDEERDAIKDEIITYNRDDVLATRAVDKWLRRFSWRSSEDSSTLSIPLGVKELAETAKPGSSTDSTSEAEVDLVCQNS